MTSKEMEYREKCGLLVKSKDIEKQADDTVHIQESEFSDLDQGGQAWLALFASFGIFCVLGATTHCMGIVYSVLLERYGARVSVTAWATSINSALFCFAAPIGTGLINRYSCRVATIVSGLFYVLGFLFTAFAPNIETAIFTVGVLVGTGSGIAALTATVIVGYNFKSRRNFAAGLASSGIGVGMFAGAPVAQLAKDYYGTSGFFIIIAGISAQTIVFGCMCFPSKLEIYTHRRRKEQVKTVLCNTGNLSRLGVYKNVLSNRGVLCIYTSIVFHNFGTVLLYTNFPTYVVVNGYTALQAAFLVSLAGILAVIGRLLTGTVANMKHVNEIVPFSGSFIGLGTVAVLYPFISYGFYGHVIFAGSYGLFYGSCYVVFATVCLKFVEVSYLSAVIGLAFFLGGIGASAGPLFTGFIIDSGGTYGQSIIVAGIGLVFAGIIGAVAIIFQRPVHVFSPSEIHCMVEEDRKHTQQTSVT